LTENQNLGKNYNEIDKDIFGYKSGQHIIFLRIMSENEIEITRFLHSRMDFEKQNPRIKLQLIAVLQNEGFCAQFEVGFVISNSVFNLKS
jgi:hypothetical protein